MDVRCTPKVYHQSSGKLICGKAQVTFQWQLQKQPDASQPQDLTWIEDLFQILATSTPESIQKIHTARA